MSWRMGREPIRVEDTVPPMELPHSHTEIAAAMVRIDAALRLERARPGLRDEATINALLESRYALAQRLTPPTAPVPVIPGRSS
jgi:hypothetical protein